MESGCNDVELDAACWCQLMLEGGPREKEGQERLEFIDFFGLSK